MNITQSENNKSQPIDLLIITAIWLIGIAIVNPLGEFPLNDDWASAQTVKQLLETGSYNPSSWLAMTLITNIAWGALFCLPAGFSFLALRISTLVAGLIGMFAVYWIGRELKLPRALRVVAALSLGFNPIYYAMSHTFMTDVPFTTLVTLSAMFLLRSLNGDSISYWYAGIAVAIAATLSRQLGVAIPLAFAVAYIFRFGFGYRSLLRGLLPLIICAVVLLAFQHWLTSRGQMHAIYLQKSEALIAALKTPMVVVREAVNGYVSLLYFGLFLLPVVVFSLPSLWAAHVRRSVSIWLALVVASGMLLAFSYFFMQPLLPLLGNILDKTGIGPLTLKDTYILGNNVPGLPPVFWSVLTWLGVAGSVFIVAALAIFVKRSLKELRPGRTTFEAAGSLFLLLAAAAYLFPLFANQIFDRYLIPVTPLVMLGLLGLFTGLDETRNRLFQYAGCVLLALFSVFSIASTHDYLSWNRERWRALTELTQVEKVSNNRIDGGFEFNGWYLYDLTHVADAGTSWWWVQDDMYLISFQSVPGYGTVKTYPYSRWLPPYEGKILVLKRGAAFNF